jgi:hypothetical protein
MNGTEQWTETHDLAVDGGLVLAELGASGSPLNTALFDGSPLWLEIQIEGEILTPRSPIGSVPYALRAEEADHAADADHASDADALGSIPAADWQRRVTGTCTNGSAISEVLDNGMVTCQPPSQGDITAVNVGSGLQGGGTSGAVTVSADYTDVQARLTNSCGSGQFIRGINQAGAPDCQSYGAGAGLELTGNTLQLPAAQVFELPAGFATLNPGAMRFCAIALVQSGVACDTSLSGGGTWTLTNATFGNGTCRWFCIPN